ncbi:MAG: GNAT family N-acetyltransferase [Planctomycetota bacterium]|nr:GNAT family N-acetyltransferase [Planctomycetota bacterium]
MSKVNIRKAERIDVDAIHALTLPFVESGQLLERTREEIVSLIGCGFSAVQADGTVVGFAAVEIYSKKLAEILCLAVSSEFQGEGVGKQLVDQCVLFAQQNEVVELMAISASGHFLKNCGFNYTLPDQKRALFINPTQRPT